MGTSSCIKQSNRFLLFDNIILHVLILFILISCLFFFFISKITVRRTNNEFLAIIDGVMDKNKIIFLFENKNNKNIVRDFLIENLSVNTKDPKQIKVLDELTDFIVNTNTAELSSFLQSMIDDFSKENPLRHSINSTLKEETCIIIAFMIIIAVIINLLPTKMGNYCGVLKHLSIELLIIFICVGIIEYWFFTNVGTKYIPVNHTVITNSFKQKINSLL
jgi:hypothetical protein